MNEHNNNDGQMEETMTDAKNPWNADLNDPYLGLKLASERLSIVRYVFLVQIEDGIASAAQRASLEYADAVLIGWPEVDAEDVVELDEEKLKSVDEQMRLMEQYIAKFSAMEREQDIDGMTDTLIRDQEDMEAAAHRLVERYGCAALVKGGHGTEDANDALAETDGTVTWFDGARINNPNTHGTGCTLSSAIASYLALGDTLPKAIKHAKKYLTGALKAQLNLGHGSGPMDHFWKYR